MSAKRHEATPTTSLELSLQPGAGIFGRGWAYLRCVIAAIKSSSLLANTPVDELRVSAAPVRGVEELEQHRRERLDLADDGRAARRAASRPGSSVLPWPESIPGGSFRRPSHRPSDTGDIPSRAAAQLMLRDVRIATSRSVAFSISSNDIAACLRTHA